MQLSSDDEANSFANRSIWSEMNETLRDTPRWSQFLQLRKSCGPRALMSARSIQRLSPCSYAIRESRIGRVIFGLRSPVMGGNSRWNILTDAGLSSTLPEVFASPPDVLSGCLHHEIQKVFQKRNPFIWEFVKARKIFLDGSGDDRTRTLNTKMGIGLGSRLATWARVSVVDRLWRG